MAYRFVQGIDYGPRKGTLGWNVHMAEGGDGTVAFLARRSGESVTDWRTRVRGVSATFVVLQTGEPVQMVQWDHAAGNLNPADRSTDKAFYGRRFLLEVLGTHWPDPNAYTLSMEVTGFRAQGPNAAQVETMVKLIEESQRRYPSIVGAFGHADQTDTKGCPGTAPLMLQFWQRVGHGRFDMTVKYTPITNEVGGTVTIKVATQVIPIEGGSRIDVAAGPTRPAIGTFTLDDLPARGPQYLLVIGDKLAFIDADAVTFTPNDGPNASSQPASTATILLPGLYEVKA